MSSVTSGFPAGSSKTSSAPAPVDGGTVVVPNGQVNLLVWITSGALLATLTVTLPTDAGSFIGQQVEVGSINGATLLTLNGPGATIFGGITALAAGTLYTYVKVAANTWARKI